MEHDQPEAADADAGEVFDQELTDVLQAQGDALEEQSRTLLATGAASIAGPVVILHARLRVPRWRRGVLEIAAEDPVSGEARGSSSIVLAQTRRDRASLIREITSHLAFELAHGLGSTGPR